MYSIPIMVLLLTILRVDTNGTYTWHQLIDEMSGKLKPIIKETILLLSFLIVVLLIYLKKLLVSAARIIHSFRITAPAGMTDDPDNQMLATKYKDGTQEIITEEYLLNFINLNQEISTKLHQFRGF